MPGRDGTGPVGQGRGVGRGAGAGFRATGGRMGGPLAAGLGGICKCPKCGYEQEHTRAQPCIKIACPKCGTIMARI